MKPNQIILEIIFSIECDEDGWTLQVNNEPKYSTFMHLFAPSDVNLLTVKGKVDVSYLGFGPKGKYTFKNVSFESS